MRGIRHTAAGGHLFAGIIEEGAGGLFIRDDTTGGAIALSEADVESPMPFGWVGFDAPPVEGGGHAGPSPVSNAFRLGGL